MTNKIFIEFFERDLDKLSAEIQLFKNENDLWKTTESIHNSAGNLALHIIGNLNHFIGMVLGGTGYERERDKEFSSRDVPREELLKGLSETKAMVLNVLPGITDVMMMEDYPFEFIKGKEPVSTAYVRHPADTSSRLPPRPGKLPPQAFGDVIFEAYLRLYTA